MPDPAPAASNPACPSGSAGPIRMVAIDLDGTLLRSDKRLSLRTARAIQQARQRGVRVVLASARPPRSVRDIYRHLDLDTLQINYNGALVHDPHRRRNLFHQPLSPKLASRIARLARRLDPDIVVSVEILDKWYTDRVDDSLMTETARFQSPDFIGPLTSFLHVPVTKLMLLAPPARLEPVRQAIREKFRGHVEILISDDYLLQVVRAGVDKALALDRVAQLYGIEPDQVMAIGDAPNDLGMLRWAGLGVAVDNAWPMVRDVAKAVVPSNDQDGVAVALEQFVLARN